MASGVINIYEVLDGHVGLELDCLDGLLENLGPVAVLTTDHLRLRLPFPSPAIFEKISNRFRGSDRSPRSTGSRSCGWPRLTAAAGVTASSITCSAIFDSVVGRGRFCLRRKRPVTVVAGPGRTLRRSSPR